MCFYYSKCFERITYIKPNNGNSIKARDIVTLILQYIKALIKTNYFKRKKIHLVSPYAAESGPNPAQKRRERDDLTSIIRIGFQKAETSSRFHSYSNFHQLKLLLQRRISDSGPKRIVA